MPSPFASDLAWIVLGALILGFGSLSRFFLERPWLSDAAGARRAFDRRRLAVRTTW